MSPVKATQFIPLELDKPYRITLISEIEQTTGSFKFRAAWNVVCSVDADHFLAASSGNFGQALACAAAMKNKGCTIVMPVRSAKVKIDAVRSYGAVVELVDTRVQSRADKVAEIAKRNPDYHIASAYDCNFVIQGNSSLGVEIARSGIPFDRVIVPVGGGGLSSGIISGFCEEGCTVPVWGAEPLMGNDAARSLREGVLIRNEQEPQTVADGARTVSLGEKNWEILKTSMNGIYEVTEAAIFRSMATLANLGIEVEPTGALTLGALLENEPISGHYGCILSGGNFDRDSYSELVLRGSQME
ncbi:MAG: pyridoxal-phosphate dependent enzyme [Myxococcota bacterium]|nr:pyridoxal-phosphate dependent enzyme [Myxococcota bacterium]